MANDATTDPAPDPVLEILGDIARSSAAQTRALGMIAREVDAGIKSFASAHGHRGAAERKILASLERLEASLAQTNTNLGITNSQVQNHAARLAPLELEVADKLGDPMSGTGNGSGNGHG